MVKDGIANLSLSDWAGLIGLTITTYCLFALSSIPLAIMINGLLEADEHNSLGIFFYKWGTWLSMSFFSCVSELLLIRCIK
ncbi:hypothetical protein GCM10008090_01850 [Arenicella chitinivorans]|uniref:Uncharacterized protein n=1 Tax=Arenicella chitinivorans TaxID=1329800 RepID=A0A918VHI7_9GAMM|nr:hypothetical protein GCM10008090_01850 [Arenicella chitinivorans]